MAVFECTVCYRVCYLQILRDYVRSYFFRGGEECILHAASHGFSSRRCWRLEQSAAACHVYMPIHHCPSTAAAWRHIS